MSCEANRLFETKFFETFSTFWKYFFIFIVWVVIVFVIIVLVVVIIVFFVIVFFVIASFVFNIVFTFLQKSALLTVQRADLL